MEERVILSVLMDLYGELLTEKQKEITNYYYNDDLSLAEIAEITNTSRQAIHDTIKRCHGILMQYEEKLGLYEKENKQRIAKEKLIDKLNNINNIDKDGIKEIIDDINLNL